MQFLRLPGGLFRDGQRLRSVRMREPCGDLELSLAEGPGDRVPRRVSRALAAAVEHIDGVGATPEVVGELCVADRQFLMHRLAERLGFGNRWLTTQCGSCASPFDFPIELSALPVREAGTGFPLLSYETALGPLTLRVPCGADQEAAAEHTRVDARWLLARCLVDGDPSTLDSLGPAQLAAVEEQLEEVSPAVVTRLRAACPSCGAAQEVPLDPYFILGRSAEALLDDVHRIACVYHWSQAEILSLPTDRRRFFLARIDRARGFVS